jgi:hypothetical protein
MAPLLMTLLYTHSYLFFTKVLETSTTWIQIFTVHYAQKDGTSRLKLSSYTITALNTPKKRKTNLLYSPLLSPFPYTLSISLDYPYTKSY